MTKLQTKLNTFSKEKRLLLAEALEERAAIIEFEAGFSREEAERRAVALLLSALVPE